MATKTRPLPPTATLHELFHYNPDTGQLTWRVSRSGTAKVGAEAGSIMTKPNGQQYRKIRLYGKNYCAHRVAWAMHYGECCPEMEIDHINGDGIDNRISNLRLVDTITNQRNQARRSNNTSGYAGVVYHKSRRKWQAEIRFNRKHLYLGLFDTAEEASEKYRKCAAHLGYHENHGRERMKHIDETREVARDA